MKKLLVVLLLICAILPAAVSAGPPVDVIGDFVYSPSVVSMRWAGDNLFIDATDTAEWTGAFVGTSYEEYVAVLHGCTIPFVAFEEGFYKGTVAFEGEVLGKAGTLVIKFVGTSPGAMDDWTGTWRIISGTGELENLHGQGVFWNNVAMDIHYEGKVHFDPK